MKVQYIGAAFLLAVTAAGAKAQGSTKLAAQARISEDSAKVIARGVVPGATFAEAELEQEKGKLIWSFDMKVPGKSGIEEVNVDAITGAVVAHEHEGPAAEKAEADAEKKTP